MLSKGRYIYIGLTYTGCYRILDGQFYPVHSIKVGDKVVPLEGYWFCAKGKIPALLHTYHLSSCVFIPMEADERNPFIRPADFIKSFEWMISNEQVKFFLQINLTCLDKDKEYVRKLMTRAISFGQPVLHLYTEQHLDHAERIYGESLIAPELLEYMKQSYLKHDK